jgi:hypothetical protein
LATEDDLFYATMEVTDVKWDAPYRSRVDWREFIGPETRKLWAKFTLDQLLALRADAIRFADEAEDRRLEALEEYPDD